MRTCTVTKYGPEDYAAFDNMSKAEVADLLENLEGNWMPGRPSGYYSGEELDEADYRLLKYCKALDLAAKWLKENDKKEPSPMTQTSGTAGRKAK